jgi:subtilisin family serine protease
VGASINSYDIMRAVMGPDIDAALYSDTSMAGFSSLGPTGDGRLKPDIAAPGWYTSAAEAISGASNDHCDVKTLRGTSMASPTMAGNAVLIQQYFNEGFYPSGSKNQDDAFVPSGALIKAMLVHSGKAMDTVTYDDGTQASTGGYPSNTQGYGKIRLSDVLNFGESTNNPITLFVKGDTNESSPLYASMSDTVTVDKFYIIAPPSSSPPSPIRVTMTYTDQVGSAGSSRPLVNDLELRVKLNGDVYVPYYNTYSDINNIEMIDIAEPCGGCNYTIEVRAVSLSVVQPYALVASGILTKAVYDADSGGQKRTAAWLITGVIIGVIILVIFVLSVRSILLCRGRVLHRGDVKSAPIDTVEPSK